MDATKFHTALNKIFCNLSSFQHIDDLKSLYSVKEIEELNRYIENNWQSGVMIHIYGY